MTTEAIINKTIKILHRLPANKVEEVADFVDYVSKKHEEDTVNNGIEKLVEQSVAFQFLHDEEELYTIQDIKEKY
jgi:aspartate carbamoyltransferase catalytic subunit